LSCLVFVSPALFRAADRPKDAENGHGKEERLANNPPEEISS
jgi:hypothetical protein